MAKLKKEELREEKNINLTKKAANLLPEQLPNAPMIKQEFIEDITSMNSQIEKYTRLYKSPDQIDYPIYIIQFMSLTKHDLNPYWVLCEVALIEFSFKNGITKKYESLIQPNEIPLGGMARCKERAEKYRLDCNLLKTADRPDTNIFKSILEFIDSSSTIFCVSPNNGVDMTQFGLAYLSDKSSNTNIIPLEWLFMALTNVTHAPISFEHAYEELLSDEFQYSNNFTCCNYHSKKDGHRICALDLLHQYAFLLSKNFCPKFNIQMIEGKHFPIYVKTYIDNKDNFDDYEKDNLRLLAKQKEKDEQKEIDEDLEAKFNSKYNNDDQKVQVSNNSSIIITRNDSVNVYSESNKRKSDCSNDIQQEKSSKQFKNDNNDGDDDEYGNSFLLDEIEPVKPKEVTKPKSMGRGRPI